MTIFCAESFINFIVLLFSESFAAPADLDPFADDEELLRPRTTTAPVLSSSQPMQREGRDEMGADQADTPDPAAIPDG